MRSIWSSSPPRTTLSPVSRTEMAQRPVVVHRSGASTKALEAARQQGALVGSIHPCQTFAGIVRPSPTRPAHVRHRGRGAGENDP
jgi:predicted short-subunit dehydrogenase-like oxidoreductase (DUF2520 family)